MASLNLQVLFNGVDKLSGPMKVIIGGTTDLGNPLLKTLYGQCMNLNCGWTGRAHMEWAATISPSATPNPEIDLPLSAIAISKNSPKHDIQNRSR